MPKPLKKHNAEPLDPYEEVAFHLKDGQCIQFQIFRDIDTGVELVQCDLCGLFFTLTKQRLPSHLKSHRGLKNCHKEKERNLNRRHVEGVVAGETATREAFFGGQSEIRPNSQLQLELTLAAPIVPNQDDPATPTPHTPPHSETRMPSSSESSLSLPDGNAPELDENPTQLIDFFDLPPSSPPCYPDSDDIVKVEGESDPECNGQWVQWTPGPIWNTYPYQRHDTGDLSWVPIGWKTGWIQIRSFGCAQRLLTDIERESGTCNICYHLLNSRALTKLMEHASAKNLEPRTPWHYLTTAQLKALLLEKEKKIQLLKVQVLAQGRKLKRLEHRVTDYDRLLILLSQNKIAGVSRILNVHLRNGVSISVIYDRLQQAINGTYSPHSGWTDREFDIAFLVKAYGGPRLLYTLQVAEGYPSLTTLQRKKPIPELTVSESEPNDASIRANLAAFLGPAGRKPPSNPSIGQVLMIDGVALEEVCRYDPDRDCILGLCREHTHQMDLHVGTMDDNLTRIKAALEDARPGKRCHFGKDGTVVGIAPVTAMEHYFVSPVVLSPSCKTENGRDLSAWVSKLLRVYEADENGQKRHGPVWILATDGESSFRNLRFRLGLSIDLDRHSELGRKLYKLVGLNCKTGLNGLTTTSDPKHIVKRFATMIRSPSGIQIGKTHISRNDVLDALNQLENMTPQQAETLLNPADKQNVPKAVNLLQSLFDLVGKKIDATPALVQRVQQIAFLIKVLSHFLFPFIKVNMSLSDQIRSLSTYAHLITALYLKHGTGFLTSALFADSQAIVKNIIFVVAQLQSIDPDTRYFILLEGTDRLEGVFSHARTHDHARNFDILQLAHKLSIGAEVNTIFERYPDLDRGHVRRNLVGARGVDHINPKSWFGNVRVGDVDLEKEYFAGRDEANRLLVRQFGEGEAIDFDVLFSDPNVDHLRPRKKYIGSRMHEDHASDEDEDVDPDFAPPNQDDDTGIAEDAFGPTEDNTVEPGGVGADMRDRVDPEDEMDGIDPIFEQLNPRQKAAAHFLEIDGVKQHKASYVPRYLESINARKTTIRPLRAWGVTVADAIRQRHNTEATNRPGSMESDIRAGDLGALLTRIGDKICLAVAEVINFKKGNSAEVAEITFDKLEESNKLTLSMAVQLLQLEALPSQMSSQGDFTWISTGTYIQVMKAGPDGAISKKHVVLRIPGEIFHPLGPSIYWKEDIPFWSLANSSLAEIMEHAWNELNPESDEIMSNIDLLPEVLGTSDLPYRIDRNRPSGLIINSTKLPFTIQTNKLDPGATFPCYLCPKSLKLRDMRNHVGKHVLKALRDCQDSLKDGIVIGLNPCGWCGRSQLCKTQLIKKGNSFSTTSNCEYHYATMVYSKAAKYSKSTPCSNVPLHCPLCPLGLRGQPQTFWKYNLVHHLSLNHLTENYELPTLSPELLFTSFVSKKEEHDMGVPNEKTESWRMTNNMPDTDFYTEWEMEQSRKRAGSILSQSSQSSTKSRHPSPTKKGRLQ